MSEVPLNPLPQQTQTPPSTTSPSQQPQQQASSSTPKQQEKPQQKKEDAPRRGFLGIWRKPIVKKDVYEEDTMKEFEREQRHYLEVAGQLWKQFRCCDIEANGFVTVNLQAEGGAITKQFKVDLRSNVTDALFAAMHELGRKEDPRLFELRLYSACSAAIEEFSMNSSEKNYLPMFAGSPLWLYSLRSNDTLELCPKDTSESAMKQKQHDDRFFIIIKVILAEVHASATFRFPRMMSIETLMRAINGCDWTQMGVHYRPINQKHFRFYSLFFLSSNLGWVSLDPQQTVASFNLPNMAILALKRRKVIELQYQCAIGPQASSFKIQQQQQQQPSSENNSNPTTSLPLSTTTAMNPKENSKEKEKRKEPKLKVIISLEFTVPEALDFLSKWVSDTFGSPLTASSNSTQQQQKSSVSLSGKPIEANLQSAASSQTASETNSDEGDNSNSTNAKLPSARHNSESDVGGDTDESDDEEDEIQVKREISKKKQAIETATPPIVQQKEQQTKQKDQKDHEVVIVTVNSPKPKIEEKIGICLRRNGVLIHGRVLEEANIVSGDFMELRNGDNAVQFIVKYTPNSQIHRSATAHSAVEFDGEIVLMDDMKDVGHVFIPPPATAETTPVIMMGTVIITNYQLVFRSYTNAPRDEIKIPLTSIDKIEKSGGKSGPADKYLLDITTKDMRIVHFVFPREGATRKSIASKLRGWCFVHPNTHKFFAFQYRSPFTQNGWLVYDIEKEYIRQGVVSNDCGWRFTHLNERYQICDTYPPLLVVPSAANDELVKTEAKYRSRGRLPVLSWRDSNSGVSITRCSQPRVGITNSKSDADEEYFELLRLTNTINPEKFYILDSRPKGNAIGNRAKGGGYEDVGGNEYPNCQLDFENIANIHVVRAAFNKMRNLCQPETDETLWFSQLEETGWFDLCKVILTSVDKTIEIVTKKKASCLIHCSDGWDRTAQCCCLSEICIDPYYRSLTGFEVLIEKDWLSFGHKFDTRYGHGNSRQSDQKAPIFPQFIFCMYQLLVQFPFSFQFNEKLLLCIMEHLYSCRFGTFLCNSDKERHELSVREKTTSLWSYVNSNVEQFLNPFFTPNSTVLFPDPSLKSMRMWDSYFLEWYRKLELESSIQESRERRNKDDTTNSWREKATHLQQELDDIKRKEKIRIQKMVHIDGNSSSSSTTTISQAPSDKH